MKIWWHRDFYISRFYKNIDFLYWGHYQTLISGIRSRFWCILGKTCGNENLLFVFDVVILNHHIHLRKIFVIQGRFWKLWKYNNFVQTESSYFFFLNWFLFLYFPGYYMWAEARHSSLLTHLDNRGSVYCTAIGAGLHLDLLAKLRGLSVEMQR